MKSEADFTKLISSSAKSAHLSMRTKPRSLVKVVGKEKMNFILSCQICVHLLFIQFLLCASHLGALTRPVI